MWRSPHAGKRVGVHHYDGNEARYPCLARVEIRAVCNQNEPTGWRCDVQLFRRLTEIIPHEIWHPPGAGYLLHDQRNAETTAGILGVEPDLKDEVELGAAAHAASGNTEKVRPDFARLYERKEGLGMIDIGGAITRTS